MDHMREISTGVPSGTSFPAIRAITSLRTRMQPWLTSLPEHPRLVGAVDADLAVAALEGRVDRGVGGEAEGVGAVEPVRVGRAGEGP